MSRAFSILLVLALVPAASPAQQVRSGTVTFISGDVYYTTLGRAAGVADSAILAITTGRDTTARLRVFALSSKSSACTLIAGTHAPNVGDSVRTTVVAPGAGAEAAADTARRAAEPVAVSPVSSRQVTPPVVQGRVSLQYHTYAYGGSDADITQPSLALALRAKIPDAPIRVELEGNIRSTVLGSQNPFAASGINQSRIYRLAVEYDDGVNRAAVGRMVAGSVASAGYIDGVAVSRRFGPVSVGGAFGYEPAFTQRTFSTDRKKFTLYTSVEPVGGSPVAAGLAYTRSFFGSELDRDLVSGSLAYTASADWFFTGQSEVDLHSWQNGEISTKPKLTSAVANITYRAASSVTVAAGVTAWRAVFPLSVVSGIADSLLDRTLWASPSVSVNLSTPGGIYLFETYAPRTSPAGFAQEFFHSTSAGIWNILDHGTNLRATWTTNAARGTRTRGYGVSADQRLTEAADLTLRWQYYDYIYTALDERSASRAFGADLVVRFLRQLSLWSTCEYATGFSGNYAHVAVDLTWRF